MRDPNFMRRAVIRLISTVLGFGLLLLATANVSVVSAAKVNPETESNRLLSISLDSKDGQAAVRLQTEIPVGYRYTVYDSFDPTRVVIDFPGMDIAGVEPLTTLNVKPLQSIRTSALSLPSGQLGRVELLLDKKTAYNVTASGNDLLVVLSGADASADSAEVPSAAREDAATGKNTEIAAGGPSVAGAAQIIDSVDLQPGRAVFNVDGKINKYRYFTMASPARLVVDLYDVRPLFKERTFSVQQGFNQMRVGTYKDRTRFVFDSDSANLPSYALAEQESAVVVNWGGGTSNVTNPVGNPSSGTVSVESVNFQKDNGKSQLMIDLSAPAEILPATLDGNIVRFGIKDATISRALRRTFDSSSFPSAVLRATPYTVLTGTRQDVRFAVELKGRVPYQLIEQGNRLLFIVDDGTFVESAALSLEQFPVPVATAGATDSPSAEISEATPGVETIAEAPFDLAQPIGITEKEQVYTGEKIRLVFDDADVRDIFRLIAEVSDLNIIVSDDVKGAITLRLIDVPWDQALDLILEIKNLGMLKKGNVVRILPKDQLRSMEESKFTAARNKEKLEDLVTEVVPVSYTDLKNVEAPSKELMTERGKITADNRNKQLIVTDIPSVIESVKKLIAILDTPERQVMIEARIVEADSTFNRNLGVNWGLFHGDNLLQEGWNTVAGNLGFGGNFVIPPGPASAAEVAGVGAEIEFGKFGADDTVLDLRLSAMESSGNGKIISRPRVTTLNGEKAKISQGTMIPYQTVSDTEITTELVEAALSLEVTPVINPDNSIILEIKATNSSPGTTVATGAGAAPSIDSKEAQTKVLVRDGETTVIGGIFVENDDFAENGVPLLRSIPYLGNLFKSTQKTNSRSELLIFITPRILN